MVSKINPDVGGGLKTLDKAFRIVDFIKANDGVTLGEITEEFGVAKSTVHRHLQTLLAHGYLIKEGDQYHLGLRFLDPAIHARSRRQGYGIIEKKVEALADETGERAQFITAENNLGIHVFSAIGSDGIESESRVGKIVYLHTTSAGKAIMAHIDSEQIDEVIGQNGLPKLTENTITSRAALEEELKTIRERGYATNRAERRSGMVAIGTPVMTAREEVLGAISVTGPFRRMESVHIEYLPDLLLDMTEDIKLRMEYTE